MAKIDDDVLHVLKNCTTNGNIVLLPSGQLERKTYQEVAKQLEFIGGKWKGGKIMGFVFQLNPTDLLAEICGGEGRNLKKEFQFFGTPAKLADRLVALAEIEDGMLVLEPSAGQGAIIESIYRAFPRNMLSLNDRPCVTVDYYELMPQNNTILSRKLNSTNEFLGSDKCQGRTSCMGEDFLKINIIGEGYQRIVANPPFNKNQDIDHIYTMYNVLRHGGKMVTIASNHWKASANKKECDFERWLMKNEAIIINLDPGEFKESGTNIATCILIINK